MASARLFEPFTIDLSRKRLPRGFTRALTWSLNRLLGFEQFNAIYRQLPPCHDGEFSRLFLDALGVSIELAGEALVSIPANGPLIVVANHPSGLIDGMVLDAVMLSIRSDVTHMAVFLLAMVPEYRDRLIFVGRLHSRSKRKLSSRGWRRSFQWVRGGGALVVFPAGMLSLFQWRRLSVADRPWRSHIGAIARRTGAPVLPIHLRVPRHWSGQFCGLVVPLLRNIRSLAAVKNFHGKSIQVTIGRLIQPTHCKHARVTPPQPRSCSEQPRRWHARRRPCIPTAYDQAQLLMSPNGMARPRSAVYLLDRGREAQSSRSMRCAHLIPFLHQSELTI